MNENELIFVYNADSDFFSGLVDFAHKLISPATYPCSLCTLTHGNSGMKLVWKSFLADLDIKQSFLYRDELTDQGLSDLDQLPLILLKNEDGKIRKLFDSAELAGMENLEAFILQLKAKLEDSQIDDIQPLD